MSIVAQISVLIGGIVMKISHLTRLIASSCGLAIGIGLTGCGGGGGDPAPAPVVNNPPAVIAPTVAINTPASDALTKGTIAIALTVTGTPTSVVLLKDGVQLTTLAAPYTFNWDTSGEAERAYSITAKAIKTGTADVLSTARQITVDRTAPAVVSRLPASGAANVSATSEISITFNEPILASSITAQSARLLIAGSAVASNAALDTAGKKLTLTFASAPALPATVTVALVGLTDAAGNVAVVADSTFTMPAAAAPSAGTLELTLPAGTLTSMTQRPSYEPWVFNVYLNNVPVGHSRDSVKLYFDGKQLIGNGFADDSSAACRAVANRVCYIVTTNQLDSYYNGVYTVTARVSLNNGTVLESAPQRLAIDVGNFGAGVSWTPSVGTVGTISTTTVPSALTTPSMFFQPQAGEFISAAAATAANGYTSEYIKRVVFSAVFLANGDIITTQFRAFAGNTAGNRSDSINVQIRTCPASPADSCSVFNSYTTTTDFGSVRLFAPYIPNGSYVEIKITFTAAGANSGSYLGNVFVGL